MLILSESTQKNTPRFAEEIQVSKKRDVHNLDEESEMNESCNLDDSKIIYFGRANLGNFEVKN